MNYKSGNFYSFSLTMYNDLMIVLDVHIDENKQFKKKQIHFWELLGKNIMQNVKF